MFHDRNEAGRRLAARLASYPRPHPLVLGLPRGGVPVAWEVATALDADLDVLIVRKLGAPGNPEFAIGAIGEDGATVIDHASRRMLHVTDEQIAHTTQVEQREIERRVAAYRSAGHHLEVAGRNVIIVDDGLATGSTAAAAVRVARHLGAAHITLAVPVASTESLQWLREMADDVVCLEVPDPYYAVGQHYSVFDQVGDDEVIRILQSRPRDHADGRVHRPARDDDVVIPTSGGLLPGRLVVPEAAHGVVLFAHGSGSSRLSPRNVAVACQLQAAGLGTVLFDLLTEDEADHRETVFDIELLAERLVDATSWVAQQADTAALPIGYFGASTGAAAALVAAAKDPDRVRAVVSRGGRPDLAGAWLEKVSTPTLLIVGGHDYAVIDLNREAQRHLHGTCLLEIVPGATHLFEEPGTLVKAAGLARSWFLTHLT